MTIRLPEELERYVRRQVESGRFTSEDEAIAEAVWLWRNTKQEAPPTPLTEEQLEKLMMESGFLGNIPSGSVTVRSRPDPVTIAGEPLSETVIRERL